MSNSENKVLKKGTGLLKEFKAFISRGNIFDMAVGVVIGSAFGKIVTSLVDNIIMPFVGMIIGGIDFSSLVLKIGNASINYGLFIQNIVDFLIVAVCIFLVIQLFAMFKKKEEEKPVEVKVDEQTLLLREIRDLLKDNK